MSANMLVPKWEGEFKSIDEWIARGHEVLSTKGQGAAICVDAKGRRCAIGFDFTRARDEGTFPIRYFRECELPPSLIEISEMPADQREKYFANLTAALRSTQQSGSNVNALFSGTEDAPLLVRGKVCELGDLDGERGERGFVVQRGESDFVTIKGLTADEVRSLVPVVFSDIVLTLGSGAANGPSADADALDKIADLVTGHGPKPQGAERIVRAVESWVRCTREFGKVIHNMTVGNQAAWIEWQRGGGAEEAMGWIENGLIGPGLIPGDCEDDIDANDPILKNAQAYYDKYSDDGMDRRPSAEATKLALKYRVAATDTKLLDLMANERLTVEYSALTPGGKFGFTVSQHHIADRRKWEVAFAGTPRASLAVALRLAEPQADLFLAEEQRVLAVPDVVSDTMDRAQLDALGRQQKGGA
jgi:hypothetical protein